MAGWIGYWDQNKHNGQKHPYTPKWTWVDGETYATTNYANWNKGQPDSGGVYHTNCAIMTSTGKWNDHKCTVRMNFMCQVGEDFFFHQSYSFCSFSQVPANFLDDDARVGGKSDLFGEHSEGGGIIGLII